MDTRKFDARLPRLKMARLVVRALALAVRTTVVLLLLLEAGVLSLLKPLVTGLATLVTLDGAPNLQLPEAGRFLHLLDGVLGHGGSAIWQCAVIFCRTSTLSGCIWALGRISGSRRYTVAASSLNKTSAYVEL